MIWVPGLDLPVPDLSQQHIPQLFVFVYLLACIWLAKLMNKPDA